MAGWFQGRAAAAGVTVLSVALVAGCGSGGASKPAAHVPPKPSGRSVVLASVVKTAAARTARVAFEMSMSGLGSVSDVTANGDGAIDLGSGDSQLTMHFGGAMASFVPGGIEARTVGGVAYVRLPTIRGFELPAGKHWLEVDPSQLGGASAGSPLGLGGGSDPTKFLAYLEKVSNSVHEVGSDEIRGVETTHYRASLDLGKAVDRANVPPALRDAAGALLGQFGDVPVDVWVDAHGLLRRMRMELDLASFLRGAGASGTSGVSGATPTVTVSLDLYDFGSPVRVVAPPADEVAPLLGNGFTGGRGSAA